ncbi:MAG: type III-B CRISPR module RAMP protein Cmr6, partial [Anaerolineae bacterium]
EYEAWRESLPVDVQQWAEDFRLIFGTTAVAGRAVFLDAIPKDKPTLDLDIMNPHFPKYYSGEEPPTDWQSPVPVYFLAVAPQTEFRFAVGWRGALDEEAKRLQSLAITWLKTGLQELGAGAKTSAGYGYFVHDLESKGAPVTETGEQTVSREAPGQPTDPHQRLVDEFKHRLQALSPKGVAGQIARFVDQWRQAELPNEYRLQMAQAILEKVEAAGRTKKSQDKEWFQELQAFMKEHGADTRGG